jgi:O-antigen/teichoic acid export membrane protein
MSTPKPRPSLATHYRRYVAGNVLVIAAGFVSFPITTRLLSSAEFGVLGYWEAWILLLTAALKLGAGDTMMRFYPHGGDEAAKMRFASNFLLLPTLLAFGAWLIVLLCVAVGSVVGFVEDPKVAFAALSIVLLQVVISHAMWLMGTLEYSGLSTMVNVIWRWAGVGVMLAVLMFVLQSALGAFLSRIFVGSILAVWLIHWVFKQLRIRWGGVDWTEAWSGLRYGLPLALKELSGIVLGFIDRLMLKWLLNDFSVVGIYTIGLGLASYVDMLISAALGQAWTPVANRLYTEQGAAAVQDSKRKVLRPLVYVCVGLAVGIALCGRDFVVLMAGQGKAEAGPIFVLASICLLLVPILSTCGMGLLLERRSGTLFAITLCAAAFNVALTYVAIPRWGAMGAAVSTCCSQIALHLAVLRFCSPSLRCYPDPKVVLRAAIAAGLCLVVGWGFDLFGLQGALTRCVVAAVLVLVLYALPVLASDSQLRRMVLRGAK